MKKLSTLLIIAFALVLGLTQCKKKVDTIATPNNLGEAVYITVNVSGDKHIVYPGTGAVVYGNGDEIYVGNNGTYVGTLTYADGKFSGIINSPSTADYLHFYFLGGLTPSATPVPGTTPDFTVSIADQSTQLPVLSYGCSTEKYTTSSATYDCTLLNKCGLVKFVPATATSDPVRVHGMKTTATIDFANPGITPTDATGTITLYPEPESDAKWAILLPQDKVSTPDGMIGKYACTMSEVPEVIANTYSISGVSMTVRQGMLGGLFTINPGGGKVHFSQGNLQAVYTSDKTSGWTWSFATNQYDYIGNATANTAVGDNVVTTDGTVDLFGWVGVSSSLAAYGINNNMNHSSYGNTVNEALKNDWGHNQISNGGNTADTWRTLTSAEWAYVFQGRTGASQKYGHGSVNGVNGMIILPDVWVLPSGLSFTAGSSAWANSYTTDQWEKMEKNGAVFLPATGVRSGSSVSYVGSSYYWSSTSHESYAQHAYSVRFGESDLNPQKFIFRYEGRSVRLVF